MSCPTGVTWPRWTARPHAASPIRHRPFRCLAKRLCRASCVTANCQMSKHSVTRVARVHLVRPRTLAASPATVPHACRAHRTVSKSGVLKSVRSSSASWPGSGMTTSNQGGTALHAQQAAAHLAASLCYVSVRSPTRRSLLEIAATAESTRAPGCMPALHLVKREALHASCPGGLEVGLIELCRHANIAQRGAGCGGSQVTSSARQPGLRLLARAFALHRPGLHACGERGLPVGSCKRQVMRA